jgi:biotin synthase
MIDYRELADDVLSGRKITREEALRVLATPEREVLELVASTARIRRAYFDNRVKLNYLVNLKSGMCAENCHYCSQALGSQVPILKYSWLQPGEAVEQADAGVAGGAARVCLVASGRGPSSRDIERVSDITRRIKDKRPDVEVCACLGLLREGQAERLVEAGVDAYNHNINTAESHHDEIVQTHSYADRIDTIHKVQRAGVQTCSGLIVGMGESDEQLVEALFALRDLEAESIPINFLVPFDGTPLEGHWTLTPMHSIKIVALTRLVCPDKEIRLAGGREIHLGTLQGLALHLANSIFLGDYLTAEGQAAASDHQLIAENGFVVESNGSAPVTDGPPQARLRHRGAGTSIDANA